MCGRYSITIDNGTIERRFNARFATGQQEFEPTYNAAPSHLVPIITTDGGFESLLRHHSSRTRTFGEQGGISPDPAYE